MRNTLGLLIAGMTAVTMQAETLVLDLERSKELDAEPYFTNGLNPIEWLPLHVPGPRETLIYDISGAGLGGIADSLELQITSLNGKPLRPGGSFGISVDGGVSDIWWDVGEDLKFAIVLKQGSTDVTDAYKIGFKGVGLRKHVNEGAVIAGLILAEGVSSGGHFAENAVPLGADLNEFTAKRTTTFGSYFQFSQIQLEIEAVSIEPIEVVVNFGSKAGGFSSGIHAVKYPVGPDGLPSPLSLVYDISGLHLHADTFELSVVSKGAGGNLCSPGYHGLTTDGAETSGAQNWWDVGEDLDFSVFIKKNGVDITSAYAVDLTGFAIRWRDKDLDNDFKTKVTATIAGESRIPSSTGDPAIDLYSIAAGGADETTFSATRSGANDAVQLGQFRFLVRKNSSP